MNLNDALTVCVQTHLDALERDERAVGVVITSGPGVGKTDTMTIDYPTALALALNQPVGVTTEFLATLTSPDLRGFMIPLRSEVPGGLPQTVFSVPPWYPVHANTAVYEPAPGAPNGGAPNGAKGAKGANQGVTFYPRGTWPHDELPAVGILDLEEFGQADEDVKKPAAELILKGTVGTTELPIGWRVVATTNRVSDRSGVMRELMFIVNRRLLLKVTGEVGPFIAWADRLAPDRQLHEATLTFAELHPGVVFPEHVPDGDEPFCTARSLVMLDRVLRALRSEQDIENDTLPLTDLAREAAAGLIGEGAAGQFYAHLRFWGEIPTLDDIENEPTRTKIPRGRDGQMVCVHMLARRVTPENAGAVITYVSRMSDELQILAVGVLNSTARAQKILLATKQYQQLLFKHKAVLQASES